jgi:hypothetical protein
MSNAANEIKKMWPIFSVGQNKPIQLRALSPKAAPIKLSPKNSTFTASQYPDPDERKRAFGRDMLRLKGREYVG